MTPEQHQEFIEYALEIKWNRDAYSRAWIIEHLMDKVDELVKNCSIPAVIKSVCVHPYENVYQSETECYCEICGHNFTEQTVL